MKVSCSIDCSLGPRKYQYIATLSSTLCIIASSMHYGWPSPSIPQLLTQTEPYTVSNEEGSWIAVMPLIAAIVGALCAGTMLDSIGRRKTILISSVPYFIAWVMVGYAPNVEIMYTARFIAGFADGICFTAVPMYIGEIADANIRGLLGSSCSVFMIFGILLVNVLGMYSTITITALISAIIPVLLLITFWFMPETPYYLIMRDDIDEAMKSLKILKGTDDVDAEVCRLASCVNQKADSSGHFFDLFSVKSNRKAMLIMVGLRTVQQLSGITAITFYTKTIFEVAGEDISSEISSTIFYSVQFILTIVSSLMLDKTGRRPLIIMSTLGVTVALLIESVYFYVATNTPVDVSKVTFIPIIGLLMFIIAYSMGLGTIPVLMLGELFPTDVKAFALVVADIYFSIIATVVSKFFQIMKDTFGMQVPFFCFTICSVLGLIFVLISVPETKGKTLEDIQDYLKGIKKVESTDEKAGRRHSGENNYKLSAV